MTRPADKINQPREPFNQPGELFGSDEVRKKVRYLHALPKDRPDAGSGPKSERPVIRRSFDSTEDEIRQANDQENPRGSVGSDDNITTSPPKRIPLVGNFAAVRSARVMHQHNIDFWDSAGVVDSIVGKPRPDPEDNDASKMYEDFLLFSYLPKAMMPSRTDFLALIQPSKSVVNIQDRYSNMGIQTPPVGSTVEPETEDTTIVLPEQPPFAENLNGFCRNGVFAERATLTR